MNRAERRRSLREDAVNLPNLLTMLRIVLIPVALYLIIEGTPRASFYAAMVYAISAITDFLDGWIARRQGLVSVLGKFLDPLADKLLVASSLIAMVAMHRVPAWAVIIIIARELSITSLRVIAMSEGVTIAAGQGGKEKAALQMVAVFMLMIHHRFDVDFGVFRLEQVDFNAIGLALLYLSVVFAITSAGEYLKLFADAVENKEKRLSESESDSPLD
ncbi:MAG: CDP-diacylglycerol--glycerol-3-phosphate 3-phosphatidyltransferase [Sandaracinaceae bacterium]|jgi:CDP-diacylglycerol--glycerol-3-phosphate 3-phosphatidyltransferase|nr:CDP-diacylglycerol--glycerol-3-phosphate 3-phosphatidyltransferase [Sandaracinaceae bacterium]